MYSDYRLFIEENASFAVPSLSTHSKCVCAVNCPVSDDGCIGLFANTVF